MNVNGSAVIKKNDTVIVTIEDMSENGEGIGKSEGYTLFVKDTVIGDRAEVKIIKAKKTYGYGRIQRLLEPSPLADRASVSRGGALRRLPAPGHVL